MAIKKNQIVSMSAAFPPSSHSQAVKFVAISAGGGAHERAATPPQFLRLPRTTVALIHRGERTPYRGQRGPLKCGENMGALLAV